MQRADVSFLVDADVPLGARWRLYADDGAGGAIDYATPIRRGRVMPGEPAATGHGLDPRGVTPRGAVRAEGGHGLAPGGQHERGDGSWQLVAETPPRYAGAHRFAFKLLDAMGNESTAAPDVVTVYLNTSPEVPLNVRATSFSGGRLSFGFSPPAQF